MTIQPALFVPLKGEYFDAFAAGTKTIEYRLYGPRWNERTCQPGRAVVLSRGYGKQQRIRARVSSFVSEPVHCLDGATWRALHALYTDEIDKYPHRRIACIGIELESSHGR